jgi:hypothetical protein
MTESRDTPAPLAGHTYLWSVEVPNAEAITGKFHTPFGWREVPNGYGNSCNIGVWNGATIPNSPNGEHNAPLTSVPAVGEDGSFQLAMTGADFRTGVYTVAYFIYEGSRSRAICATLTLSNGRPINSEHTSVAVTRQEFADGQYFVTLAYTSPAANIPYYQADSVVVCAGGQPVQPDSNIGWMVVADDEPAAGQNTASGSVRIPLTTAPISGGQYVAQYDPGNDIWAISAYSPFTWTL